MKPPRARTLEGARLDNLDSTKPRIPQQQNGVSQFLAKYEFCVLVAVAEKPVMPDFHEIRRQNMNKKPANELIGFKRIILLIYRSF
jgi:hypothetical protein